MFPNAFVPLIAIDCKIHDSYRDEKNVTLNVKADSDFEKIIIASKLPEVVKWAVLEIAGCQRFYLPTARMQVQEGEIKWDVEISVR